MSDLIHILTHVADAQDRLLEQYKGTDDMENLIEILATEIQTLEDAVWGLYTLRDINNAVGAQLDKLGIIVGITRNTTDDDIYRLEIRAKIVKNVSQGQGEKLISVYKFMTEATHVVFQDTPPAAVMIASDGIIPPALLDANLIYSLVKSAAAGGVKVGALVIFDPVAPFGYAGPRHLAKGFASVASPTQGGKYAHLLKERYPFGYGLNNPAIRGFGTITLNEPNIGGKYVAL